MTTISAAGLSGWSGSVVAMARDAGVPIDPDGLLATAGIDPAVVGRLRVQLPFASFARALELAAAGTGRADAGRVLAAAQPDESLGVLLALVRTAPTLRDALDGLARFARTMVPGLDVALEVDGALGHFWFRPSTATEDAIRAAQHLPGGGAVTQATELLLSHVLRLGARATNNGLRPLAVLVPHQPMTHRESYESRWGRPVEFGRRAAGIWLATSDLERPTRRDPSVHRIVRAYVQENVVGGHPTLTATVRREIERQLPDGTLELDVAAARLGMHARTLQRRLADEGTSIRELTDAVRRDVVRRLLSDADLDLAEVARRAGYSEQSVLTRASRRWFGATPTQVRRRLLAPADAPAPSDRP